jgi:hypothetical protein
MGVSDGPVENALDRAGDGGAAEEELPPQGEGYRDADGDIMGCGGEGGDLTLGGTVAMLRDIHRICHPSSAEGADSDLWERSVT